MVASVKFRASEMSVHFNVTAQLYIPEDSKLQMLLLISMKWNVFCLPVSVWLGLLVLLLGMEAGNAMLKQVVNIIGQ
jgi:hypothetical protein